MIIERKVRNYLTPADCQNMSELQEYARQKGYKPGWAYYQAKARGFINGTQKKGDSLQNAIRVKLSEVGIVIRNNVGRFFYDIRSAYSYRCAGAI